MISRNVCEKPESSPRPRSYSVRNLKFLPIWDPPSSSVRPRRIVTSEVRARSRSVDVVWRLETALCTSTRVWTAPSVLPWCAPETAPSGEYVVWTVLVTVNPVSDRAIAPYRHARTIAAQTGCACPRERVLASPDLKVWTVLRKPRREIARQDAADTVNVIIPENVSAQKDSKVDSVRTGHVILLVSMERVETPPVCAIPRRKPRTRASDAKSRLATRAVTDTENVRTMVFPTLHVSVRRDFQEVPVLVPVREV